MALSSGVKGEDDRSLIPGIDAFGNKCKFLCSNSSLELIIRPIDFVVKLVRGGSTVCRGGNHGEREPMAYGAESGVQGQFPW